MMNYLRVLRRTLALLSDQKVIIPRPLRDQSRSAEILGWPVGPQCIWHAGSATRPRLRVSGQRLRDVISR
jgi:hypothetical protein